MPTFNQLVRKGRQTSEKKSTAPALQKGFNSLKKKSTNVSAPQKRGVCTAVKTEEDNEMIRCIRGMKMENGQLYDLLDGIQNGTVKFQVSRESDEEGSGSFV